MESRMQQVFEQNPLYWIGSIPVRNQGEIPMRTQGEIEAAISELVKRVSRSPVAECQQALPVFGGSANFAPVC